MPNCKAPTNPFFTFYIEKCHVWWSLKGLKLLKLVLPHDMTLHLACLFHHCCQRPNILCIKVGVFLNLMNQYLIDLKLRNEKRYSIIYAEQFMLKGHEQMMYKFEMYSLITQKCTKYSSTKSFCSCVLQILCLALKFTITPIYIMLDYIFKCIKSVTADRESECKP